MSTSCAWPGLLIHTLAHQGVGWGCGGQPGPRCARSHSCDVHWSPASYIPAPVVVGFCVTSGPPSQNSAFFLAGRSTATATTIETYRILKIYTVLTITLTWFDGGFHRAAPERSDSRERYDQDHFQRGLIEDRKRWQPIKIHRNLMGPSVWHSNIDRSCRCCCILRRLFLWAQTLTRNTQQEKVDRDESVLIPNNFTFTAAAAKSQCPNVLLVWTALPFILSWRRSHLLICANRWNSGWMSPLSPSRAGRYTATDKRAEKAGRASPQFAGVNSHSFLSELFPSAARLTSKVLRHSCHCLKYDNKTVWISVNRRETNTVR